MLLSELTPEQIKDIESKCIKVPCNKQEVASCIYTCIGHEDFMKVFNAEYKDKLL